MRARHDDAVGSDEDAGLGVTARTDEDGLERPARGPVAVAVAAVVAVLVRGKASGKEQQTDEEPEQGSRGCRCTAWSAFAAIPWIIVWS
jgi:hypothetical protein